MHRAAGEFVEKWQFPACGDIDSTPAIGSVAIYVTCYSGFIGGDRLYAIDIRDGSLLWESQISASTLPLNSSPAVAADGTIYVGSGFLLVAFEPAGNRKWEVETRGWIKSSPAIEGDGTIYVGSNDGSLYATNPDGSSKWEVAPGGVIENSPAIGADGTVYVGSGKKLVAIDSSQPSRPVNLSFPAQNNAYKFQ